MNLITRSANFTGEYFNTIIKKHQFFDNATAVVTLDESENGYRIEMTIDGEPVERHTSGDLLKALRFFNTFLSGVGFNRMCRDCMTSGCNGTTCQAWTGCVLKA